MVEKTFIFHFKLEKDISPRKNISRPIIAKYCSIIDINEETLQFFHAKVNVYWSKRFFNRVPKNI